MKYMLICYEVYFVPWNKIILLLNTKNKAIIHDIKSASLTLQVQQKYERQGGMCVFC